MIGNLLLLLYFVSIPFGIDPEGFRANLYCYDYKADFVYDLIKTDGHRAIKSKNTSCMMNVI